MNIAIVGGGPSGLFTAILIKQRQPKARITVYERNPDGATFGFGVVLADTGLNRLHQAAPEVIDELTRAMVFTSAQSIMLEDEKLVVARPGKGGGAIPRIQLLAILQKHARQLDIEVKHNHPIESLDELSNADLIVGADGINSMVRNANEAAFGTHQYSLTNHFAWYGVNKVFTHPALVFRTYQGGYFIAHYYPYSDNMSTFVAECDDQTWNDLGMAAMSDEERTALFETIFAPELEGSALVSNNSVWRQFPVIRNRHWYHENQVLIGDALSSAHFSIGSGTRIAMEDAITLAECVCQHANDIPYALSQYEARRKPDKAKLINASEASFNWYEKIRTWMNDYQLAEFVYEFMTRTGRVDTERLRAQFPELAKVFEQAGVIEPRRA